MPEFLTKLESVDDKVRLTFSPDTTHHALERLINRDSALQLASVWNAFRRPNAEASIQESRLTEISDSVTNLLLGPVEMNSVQMALKNAIRKKEQLTLVFEFHDPTLTSLPLELLSQGKTLQSKPNAGYLALHPSITIERRFPHAGSHVALPEDPLRILVATSNPAHPAAPHLSGVQQEARSLHALFDGVHRHNIQIRMMEEPSNNSLEHELRSFRPTVLHLSGHFLPTRNGFGYVVRDEGQQGIVTLSGEQLREMLLDAGTKLCVLNGCRNSGTSSGIAESIASTGEVSVVGHQFEILDDDSTDFATGLYTALMNGTRVAEAIAGLRRRMASRSHTWLFPLFYSHARQFRIAPDRLAQSKVGAASIVGRKEISEEIVHALLYGEEPVVNLAGPAGIGKSALCGWLATVFSLYLEVDARIFNCDGMSLSSLREEVGRFLLAEQELDDERPFENEISRDIPAVSKIVILDNAAAISEIGDFLKPFIESAVQSGTRVVVVGRAPMTEIDSQVIQVGPMQLASDGEDIEESTRLFIDTWREDVSKRHGAIKTINGICSKLQGHPGLIQAVASLANLVPLTELARKIVESPEFVSTALGEDVEYAVPKEVFSTLPEDLKALLEVSSLFHDVFTAEDVSAISGLSLTEVTNGLMKLVESGIVVAQRDQPSSFSLLASARARLKQDIATLESHRKEALFESFVKLYLDFGAETSGTFKAGGWDKAWVSIRRKKGDIQATIEYLIETKDDKRLLEAFSYFGRSLFEAGEWGLFETMAVPALEAAKKLGTRENQVSVLGLLGALRACQRRNPDCYALWEERAKIAHELGDYATEADTLLDIGWQRRDASDSLSRDYIFRALKVAQKGRSKIYIATAYAQLAATLAEDGYPDEAACYVKKAKRLSKKVLGEEAVLFVLNKTGFAADRIGDVHSAIEVYLQGFLASKDGSRHLQAAEVLYRIAVLMDKQNNLLVAMLALELAKRRSDEKRWVLEDDLTNFRKSVRDKMTARKMAGEDIAGVTTYELQRLLVRGLRVFLDNDVVK